MDHTKEYLICKKILDEAIERGPEFSFQVTHNPDTLFTEYALPHDIVLIRPRINGFPVVEWSGIILPNITTNEVNMLIDRVIKHNYEVNLKWEKEQLKDFYSLYEE